MEELNNKNTNFNDIFYRMNRLIMETRPKEFSIESQKELVKLCLKKYTLEKLQELGFNKMISDAESKALDLIGLFDILVTMIPKKKHFDTIRFYIHYILEFAGSLQGWSITWYSENQEDTEILFDIDGKWTELTTPLNEDYAQTFKFVYDVFKNKFMVKSPVKKINSKSKN